MDLRLTSAPLNAGRTAGPGTAGDIRSSRKWNLIGSVSAQGCGSHPGRSRPCNRWAENRISLMPML